MHESVRMYENVKKKRKYYRLEEKSFANARNKNNLFYELMEGKNVYLQTIKYHISEMIFKNLDLHSSEDDDFGLKYMLSYDRMRTSAIMNTYGREKQKLNTTLFINVKELWIVFLLLGISSNECRERTPICQWCMN